MGSDVSQRKLGKSVFNYQWALNNEPVIVIHYPFPTLEEAAKNKSRQNFGGLAHIIYKIILPTLPERQCPTIGRQRKYKNVPVILNASDG